MPMHFWGESLPGKTALPHSGYSGWVGTNRLRGGLAPLSKRWRTFLAAKRSKRPVNKEGYFFLVKRSVKDRLDGVKKLL